MRPNSAAEPATQKPATQKPAARAGRTSRSHEPVAFSIDFIVRCGNVPGPQVPQAIVPGALRAAASRSAMFFRPSLALAISTGCAWQIFMIGVRSVRAS